MTNQPNWELIANLGDVNPIDYGGYFVYRDTTGVYEPEAEYLFTPDSDTDGATWTVYRFSLDRLKMVKGYMVSAKYKPSWPHALHEYQEWFLTCDAGLESVAETYGIDAAELQEQFCSSNPLDRAIAYQAIGEYHGFDNLDSYPLHFSTRAEVEKRYAAKVQQ